MADQSYLGIGYNCGSFNGQNLGTSDNDNGRTVPVTDVENLMRSYMQQCVEYHEQHEHEQQNQKLQQEDPVVGTGTVPVTTSVVHLSPPPPLQEMNFIPATTAKPTSSTIVSVPDHASTTASVSGSQRQTPEFTAALERAKAIAQRLANGTSALTSSGSTYASSGNYPYAQKRWEFFEKHRQKLRTRWIENLQYLAQKDEEQLQQMKNQIVGVNDMYNRQQRKRPRREGGEFAKNMIQSMAGIGSQERHHVQKEVERRVSSLSPCGIYITGLSKIFEIHQDDHDGDNTTERTLMELFSAYGKVSSVKLYSDRKTGRKKGDGLILYDWASIRKKKIATLPGGGTLEAASSAALDADDVKDFQNMVCTQLNGVELPCGVVMNAEPMNTDYKNVKKQAKNGKGPKNKQKEFECNNNPKPFLVQPKAEEILGNLAGSNGRDAIGEGEEDCTGDDDDLDDFFASLE